MLEGLPRLEDFLALVEGFYARYGYLAVFFGALCENTALFGLVFPGGTMVLLGAVYARMGHLSLPLVILLGWLGTFLGASIDYWAGRRGVHRVLARLPVGDHRDRGLREAQGWLDRYGLPTFLLAHFVGHTRSLAAVTAGVSHLPYWRFAVYELVAALLWNAVYCVAGYALAANIELVERTFGRVGLVVVLAVGGLVVWQIARRWPALQRSWRGWRARSRPEPSDEGG